MVWGSVGMVVVVAVGGVACVGCTGGEQGATGAEGEAAATEMQVSMRKVQGYFDAATGAAYGHDVEGEAAALEGLIAELGRSAELTARKDRYRVKLEPVLAELEAARVANAGLKGAGGEAERAARQKALQQALLNANISCNRCHEAFGVRARVE